MVLHKNKNWTERGNYRGILLVAHASKILLRLSFAASASSASAWGSCRRDRVVSDRTVLHRHHVCDSSITGTGAEETNSTVCMMYALSTLPKRTTPWIEPSSGQFSPVLACHRI